MGIQSDPVDEFDRSVLIMFIISLVDTCLSSKELCLSSGRLWIISKSSFSSVAWQTVVLCAVVTKCSLRISKSTRKGLGFGFRIRCMIFQTSRGLREDNAFSIKILRAFRISTFSAFLTDRYRRHESSDFVESASSRSLSLCNFKFSILGVLPLKG